MMELYWGLLITGVLFALVTVLFGDLLSSAVDGLFDWMSGDVLHYLQPMVLFSGLTVLGGAGILLTKYSPFAAAVVLILSLLAAVLSGVLIYFFYIKPMENTENSLAFSMQDLVGRIGEVSVPIPAQGCGEVMMRMGGGVTNQIAESFDGNAIEAGTRVVTVEVIDGTLFVTCLDEPKL
ncbi:MULTISPECIES: NfeD family protein [unclassified Paenibacillus]|uniref:NfeD family protein n=1 Tax=unclassified Paenibacillus TaxID=185978 RepID=UPI001AE9E73C|nr:MULTISPECIES: NfeD family protein [unclassified Paenibacillus]MBP1155638.1 membrane protein implicated in regulation of membrane protease activity [Paenibacillus sp. PvP091]MBP1168976.1 membrane protein implicated in regulation of membrane protease activity [Paenibacillus sp. PvR098]MBP2440004.1 membrane protein implicated in regulation of membrane protease activity [Paenibacillus sp. PvP052]